MRHPEISDFVVGPNATLGDAMTLVDRSGLTVALLVATDGSLLGILTDGDMRRAILAGATLDSAALLLATTNPTTVVEGTNRAHALDLMRARHIQHLPVLDAAGRVVGLHTLADIVGRPERPNLAVVMAGGRGVRLGALTEHTPKPLVRVAGRPIIEWVILNLVGDGISRFRVSVNYLAEQIVEHLGDGRALGIELDYILEDPASPLGTAGSLSLLDRESVGDEPLIVTNADLLVQFEVGGLLDAHISGRNAVTVATRRYEHAVPFGVVERTSGDRIRGIVEKPVIGVEVNAGIYALSPGVLDLVPRGQPSTMPGLVDSCLARGLPVGAWAMESDWIDVGSPRDLARARGVQ